LAGPQPSPLLAVFDFDGTLVDSQHRIVSAMQAAFAAEGVGRPEPAAVRRIIGLPLETGIRQLAPGVGGLALERLVAGYREQSFGRGSSGDIEPMMPGRWRRSTRWRRMTSCWRSPPARAAAA
jgi:phosphoglycolate phosphatase